MAAMLVRFVIEIFSFRKKEEIYIKYVHINNEDEKRLSRIFRDKNSKHIITLTI